MSSISENIRACSREIEDICHAMVRGRVRARGTDPATVRLVVATKYASVEQMKELCGAGVKAIGENRIQDAVAKFEVLKNFPAFQPLEKHFFGHLQRNKVKQAVQWFDVIDAVDSIRLAEALELEAQKQHKSMRVYIEVNIGDEPQKYGVQPDEVMALLTTIAQFSCIHVEGLMTVFPFFDDVERVRPYAKRMKQLFGQCAMEFPQLKVLSMGMSHDMRIAIEEGATEVRIGRRIIGK